MTTWIDLTDLIEWRGTFTGIQRVTYEYARRFANDGARFFAYDAIDLRFYELTLAEINENSSPKDEVGSMTWSHENIPFRRQVRQFIGKPYYNMTDERRAMLYPYVFATNHTVRTVLHYAGKINRTSGSVSKKQKESPHRHLPSAQFSRDDTVVLLGAGWNDSRTLDALIEFKQHTAIHISQHVNDILPIYQPQLFADELPQVFRPFIEKVVRYVDTITVISEATKRDLLVFCKEVGVKKPLIHTIRLGDNPESTVTPLRPSDRRIKKEKFILAVGTFEVRKNYTILYQAVKLAQLEKREIPMIVIAGRKGWLSEDLRHIIERDPYTQTHIVWLDDVSDSELKWLYKNCMFTTFPSLAEGWGLPVAESLANGKFCLTSGVSSMLEVANDNFVDYFLPYDSREWLEKVAYYLVGDRYSVRNNYVSKQFKPHSWDESYSQLKATIKT